MKMIVIIEEEWIKFFRCGSCGTKNILPDEIDDEKHKCNNCQKTNMIDIDEAGLDDSDDILDDGDIEIETEDIEEAFEGQDDIIDDTEM